MPGLIDAHYHPMMAALPLADLLSSRVGSMVTHDNAQLLKLSGPGDPHQQGDLGVVKEDAHADLILAEGHPLEDLDVIVDTTRNFVVIMKDGRICKNTVE